MPCEQGYGPAVWSPRLGEDPDFLFGRSFGEAQHGADSDLDGQVAGGPHVAAAFGEQEVDFGGPAADALYLDEVIDGLFVVLGKGVEYQFAGNCQLGQRPGVSLLLARQTTGPQGIIVVA